MEVGFFRFTRIHQYRIVICILYYIYNANFSVYFFLYKIYFFLTHIVREQCGHTLKSSLRHILSVDRRDNPVFPTEGSLFKLVQEYAGIGKVQFVVQFHGIFVYKTLI